MDRREPPPPGNGSRFSTRAESGRFPSSIRSTLACGGGFLLAGLIAASFGVSRGPREGTLLVRSPEKIWQPSVEGKDGSYIPPDPTKVVPFEVENIGRTPVRVKMVETTCGCTSARIEPSVINPGVIAIVKAHPSPFPTGEQMVAITLHTDSSSTPTVHLRLRIRGMMRPPYLLAGKGDLTFKGKSFASESRAFEVAVVESEGSSPRLPEIRTDLPFVSLSPLVFDHEDVYPGSNAPVRRYTSTLRFVREPPAPYVTGEVTILDPWHSAHVEKLPVSVEVLPGLRAAPSRIVLVAKSSMDWSASATLLIFSDEPDPALRIEVLEGGPLLVRRETADPRATPAFFSIRLKPDLPVRGGEYRLVVRPSTSSAEPITIPVHVRLETSS